MLFRKRARVFSLWIAWYLSNTPEWALRVFSRALIFVIGVICRARNPICSASAVRLLLLPFNNKQRNLKMPERCASVNSTSAGWIARPDMNNATSSTGNTRHSTALRFAAPVPNKRRRIYYKVTVLPAGPELTWRPQPIVVFRLFDDVHLHSSRNTERALGIHRVFPVRCIFFLPIIASRFFSLFTVHSSSESYMLRGHTWAGLYVHIRV